MREWGCTDTPRQPRLIEAAGRIIYSTMKTSAFILIQLLYLALPVTSA